MSKSKCCSGTCPKPVAHKCPWKLFRIEEGARVFTGEKCGLALCGEHCTLVNGKALCLWHGSKAKEMGFES